jgi:uncharacterized protein YjbI with pentapeptide repeats
MIEIKHRKTKEVLIRDEAAETLRDAVGKAIANRQSLRSADLSGADLSGADLSGAYLSGAYLSGADLRSADLRSAYLSGADLSGAYLSGADLRSAYLRSADLRSADLRSADLRSADLRSADLRSADLSGAYLSGAYLSGADLSGADLSGADLRSADLRSAKGIDAKGKSTPLTDADYIEIRDEFRKKHPEIPIVANLDSTICEIVNSGKGSLDMSDWHSCKTTHCRAGWAIHLAGKPGYDLEKRFSAHYAGAMIYVASTGRRPDFFASNHDALKDICKWGAKEQATA